MSKVDTDQGLGPGSEPRRKELLGINSDGSPRNNEAADKEAETQPGSGKPKRENDPVDNILEGFGPSRPDQPRILPQDDTTPPPDPAKEEIPSTSPGKRQRTRNMVLAMVATFVAISGFGIGVVKLATNGSTAPRPSATPANTSTSMLTSSGTTAIADTIPPPPTITTMEVEALPTVKTAAPVMTGRPSHSGTATVTATARPSGSAPPGMSLLPDDPHR